MEKIENFKRNLYQPENGEPCGHAHFIMQFAQKNHRKLMKEFASNIHPEQRNLSERIMSINGKITRNLQETIVQNNGEEAVLDQT